MGKKYIVRLMAQEREVCQQTLRKLNGGSEKVRRAQILVKADADGPRVDRPGRSPMPFRGRTKTVENIRQRCVLEGFRTGAGAKTTRITPGREAARRRTGVPGHRPASGAAPEGLCELVATAVGAPGRRVGGRRVDQPRNHPADAEKNGMTQRKIEYWVIPAAGRCRVRGEHGTGLGSVSETLRSGLSVVCMDEQPVQLVKEARPPIAATKKPSPACRLRVRTGRYGVDLLV